MGQLSGERRFCLEALAGAAGGGRASGVDVCVPRSYVFAARSYFFAAAAAAAAAGLMGP